MVLVRLLYEAANAPVSSTAGIHVYGHYLIINNLAENRKSRSEIKADASQFLDASLFRLITIQFGTLVPATTVSGQRPSDKRQYLRWRVQRGDRV